MICLTPTTEMQAEAMVGEFRILKSTDGQKIDGRQRFGGRFISALRKEPVWIADSVFYARFVCAFKCAHQHFGLVAKICQPISLNIKMACSWNIKQACYRRSAWLKVFCAASVFASQRMKTVKERERKREQANESGKKANEPENQKSICEQAILCLFTLSPLVKTHARVKRAEATCNLVLAHIQWNTTLTVLLISFICPLLKCQSESIQAAARVPAPLCQIIRTSQALVLAPPTHSPAAKLITNRKQIVAISRMLENMKGLLMPQWLHDDNIKFKS